MPPAVKRLRYEVSLGRAGGLVAEGETPLDVPRRWTAEHLLLAALARCSLTSLRYHVRRAGGDVAGSVETRGLVTKRGSDGRYALVEVEVSLDVSIEPAPDPAALGELLAKAERDCFVGASLSAPPRYAWRVNGAGAEAPG